MINKILGRCDCGNAYILAFGGINNLRPACTEEAWANGAVCCRQDGAAAPGRPQLAACHPLLTVVAGRQGDVLQAARHPLSGAGATQAHDRPADGVGRPEGTTGDREQGRV